MSIIRDVLAVSTQALLAQHGVAVRPAEDVPMPRTLYDWRGAPEWAVFAAAARRRVTHLDAVAGAPAVSAAVLVAPFGNVNAAHAAAAANATFERAIKLGYSRVCAQAFAREAKRDANAWESAAETAFRIVRPKHISATSHTQPPRGAA